MYKILITIVVIALLISGCAKPQPRFTYSNVNLLSNPGFEKVSNGFFTDWSTDGAGVRSDFPHSGNHYLIGGYKNKALTHTYQSIDLLANGYSAKELDSYKLVIKYGGYQSGWKNQKDNGAIAVRFYDKDKKEIRMDVIGKFYGPTWVKKQKTAGIPKGTRYITYFFTAQRMDYKNNDANLDDAFVYVGRLN